MTTVTLELPDQLVRAVEQRAVTRGLSLSQQVSELLEESTQAHVGQQRADIVRRMDELFDQASGFQFDPHISREELYERGSLR